MTTFDELLDTSDNELLALLRYDLSRTLQNRFLVKKVGSKPFGKLEIIFNSFADMESFIPKHQELLGELSSRVDELKYSFTD